MIRTVDSYNRDPISNPTEGYRVKLVQVVVLCKTHQNKLNSPVLKRFKSKRLAFARWPKNIQRVVLKYTAALSWLTALGYCHAER